MDSAWLQDQSVLVFVLDFAALEVLEEEIDPAVLVGKLHMVGTARLVRLVDQNLVLAADTNLVEERHMAWEGNHVVVVGDLLYPNCQAAVRRMEDMEEVVDRREDPTDHLAVVMRHPVLELVDLQVRFAKVEDDEPQPSIAPI